MCYYVSHYVNIIVDSTYVQFLLRVLDAGGDGSFASSRGGTVPECLMIAIVRSTGNSDKMKVLTVPYVWPCGDFP